MSKNKIVIRFKSLYELWQFLQTIKTPSVEIRIKERLLICECSNEEIQSAVKYGGEIIRQLVES